MGKSYSFSYFIRRAIVFLIIIFVVVYAINYFVKIAYPLKYKSDIKQYSKQNSLDPYFLTAIIREESRFDPNIVSKKGAVGLMQLMPKTARWIAKKANYNYIEGNLSNSSVNIKYGSWYISYLQKKYNNKKLALAAYNGGTTNVDKWIEQNGINTSNNIPFKETRNFVNRVISTSKIYKKIYPDEF